MRRPARFRRITIGGLLLVVAVLGLLINAIRPISHAEAERIAVRRFLELPGAPAWEGQVRPDARRNEPAWSVNSAWSVNIVADDLGVPIAQILLDRRGREAGAIVTLPWHISPIPTRSLGGPLPAPGEWRVDPMGPRTEFAPPAPGP